MLRKFLMAIGLVRKPKPLWVNPRYVGPDFKPRMGEETAANLRRAAMAAAAGGRQWVR